MYVFKNFMIKTKQGDRSEMVIWERQYGFILQKKAQHSILFCKNHQWEIILRRRSVLHTGIMPSASVPE